MIATNDPMFAEETESFTLTLLVLAQQLGAAPVVLQLKPSQHGWCRMPVL
jgi:hypothetical protein